MAEEEIGVNLIKKNRRFMNTVFFQDITGQDAIKQRLERLTLSGKLPHALLFHGPKGVGKEAAALALGRALLCTGKIKPCGVCNSCRLLANFEHPDLYFLFPIKKPKKDFSGGEWESAMNDDEVKAYREELNEKKKDNYYEIDYPNASEIIIGQVRRLIQMSSITSYLGGSRVGIISPGEAMNKEAQNSLLKLLEEPPQGFFLIVVSHNPEGLYPTIISRCQPFYFPPLPADKIKTGLIEKYGIKTGEAEKAASMADGSFVKAKKIALQGDPARDIALNEFMVPLLKSEFDKIYFFCHKYSSSGDKTELKEILNRMEQFIRDVEMIDASFPPKMNKDLLERLNMFRNNINYTDLSKIRKLIMEAVDLMDKNVYIDLIITNLANRMLKELAWKKKSA